MQSVVLTSKASGHGTSRSTMATTIEIMVIAARRHRVTTHTFVTFCSLDAAQLATAATSVALHQDPVRCKNPSDPSEAGVCTH